ncbi:helix-turn-helix domain-containing protein [Nocardioides sp. dk4132]|uniref:helix-turn-helix transcriptional regulator n=1 Tax=unclassified Nocardioides TaxID=2615069 RepID=UPI001296565A|nr:MULTISPECIES: helix-turn-helix domain-containing protein [unclassified Nocardioides]MQW77291.1 helix-turn-helix domain-containing protein [Nocardioides sp. dk4132]QGA08045.1 helix-turn-helix domain-containing protein [Nocardioides sp. dk884]
MMATNSHVPAMEPEIFGPQRRGVRGSRAPRLVDAQELWDIDDVATYLGVTKQTIYSWRTTGYGPTGFRVGKHLRWRAATVINWTVRLEENR